MPVHSLLSMSRTKSSQVQRKALMFCSRVTETIMILMLVSLALNRCKNVVVLVIHTFMYLFACLVIFSNTKLHQQTSCFVFIKIIFSALLPLCFRQCLTMWPCLSWNMLCKPGWHLPLPPEC